MNVKSTEKREKCTMQLVVEVTAEEFENALNKAYKKNKNSIMVPGFRKGKAPRKIVESMYGDKVFYEDAVNEICPDAFEFAVKDQDIKAVGRPSVEDVNFNDDKTVVISFVTGLYPELTLGEYKGVKAVKRKPVVEDKDVDEALERARKKNARISSVEREAQNGDTAVIDFEGFMDGKAFDGGKGEGYPLELGSGSFVPGFEEQVVGMKAGDEKDVNITFPEDYHEGLAGKAVVFKVKVNEVKEKILPELDDEFVKDISDFETLEEYRKHIAEEILASREADAQAAFEEAAMAKVVDAMEGDVPDSMVEERAERMVEEFRYNLMNQGLKYEDYLQMMGIDSNTFMQNLLPGALRQIKQEIALDKIVEAENIQITDEELELETKKEAASYGMDVEKFKEVAGDYLKTTLAHQKANELVAVNAVAVDEEPAEEKPAKKPAAKKSTKKAADEVKEGEEPPKKPAAKKTTKKAAEEVKEGEEAPKKPAAKKTTKKADEEKKDDAE